jgi:hypothetical protein
LDFQELVAVAAASGRDASAESLGLCQRHSARAPVFPLYFTGNLGVGPSGRDGARLQRDSADIGRIGFVLRADPKAVESNEMLQVSIVTTAG